MMRLPIHHRTASIGLLAAAMLLGGCAYKNPLIEDGSAKRTNNASVAAANAPSTASNPSPASAAPAIAATGVAATGSAAAAPSVASSAAAPAKNTASNSAANATPSNTSLTTTREQRRFGGLLTPYRIDIQQGNFVSEEMVSQLKAGMTPEQVRFVLGTPLLNDMFHANRWDYAFELKRGASGEITRGRLTVFFKDKRLDHWEGGDLPNEQDYLAKIAGSRPDRKPVEGKPASAAAPSTAKEPK